MFPLFLGHGLAALGRDGSEVGNLFGCHRLSAERTDFGANLTEFLAGLAHNIG